MTSIAFDTPGRDPRLDLSEAELALASAASAPEVGKASRGPDLGLAAGVACAVALGGATLFMMSGGGRARAAAEPAKTEVVAVSTRKTLAAAPAPPPAAATVALAAPAGLPANVVDPNQSRANPLIVDNSEGVAPGPPGKAPPAAASAPGPGQSQVLSADEQFSVRVGADGGGAAYAQDLTDPATTVVQGTMIPAVLETALNSDLPGYARAIVSKDVRGFDGAKIIIPRGSRLIGQYKSGVSVGASRAFVIWTRLIRPDGVSIQLGSPVMDESGETGLTGQVNRHFLQRFGGAMLLSVVSALPSALLGGGSNALVINSGSDATSAAGQALAADARISPTIKVPLGTPIQVFAARDLAFGGR